MKTMYKAIIAVAAVLLLMPSCTGKFEEMNTSPNSPSSSTVDPKLEFQYAVARSISYRNTYQGSEAITFATFAEYDGNSTQSCSDYSIPNGDLSDFWDRGYSCLANLNNIIRLYENDEVNVNLVAMSKIWRATVVLRVTDLYGDVPFSEACSAEATAPKYDSQADIYKALFADLEEAARALDASKPNIGNYDLIYAGDVAKWKTFANSLRLRMACRVANADKALASAQAKAALSAGVFASVADEANMAMGGESNSDYSWNPLYYGRANSHSTVHMTKGYENLVTGLGGIAWPDAAAKKANANYSDEVVAATVHPAIVDPRAPIHYIPVGQKYNPADMDKVGAWRGSQPGCANPTTLSGEFTDGSGDNATNYSPVGPFFYATANKPWSVMKYAEVCFLKAIAIENGLASASEAGCSAQAAYEAGIKADLEFFGVPAETINAYIASTEKNTYGTSVLYSDHSGSCNTAMDKILTQKYIAGFLEGALEAWSDHRQYHKPTLVPFAHVVGTFQRSQSDVDNNTPKAYIKRFYYPTSEQTLNPENYESAVAKIGGDNVQTNVWWDVD